MYLLNIQSSPRRSRSASIAVADAFLEAYRQVCPEAIVDTLNVWDEKLPEFDQEAIGAKYKGINQEPMDEAEQKVWDRIQELVARFKRADRLVIGVPMWNEFWLPFIGVREVRILVVESTSWGGKEKGKYSVERGMEAARELAAHF
jgi:FMN-dependent NADH-azoreductase